MGLCLGKTSPWPRDVTPEIAGAGLRPSQPGTSPWPDLPPEITGLVFSRLPSHDDRLSLAAVCHDWRLAAQRQRSLLRPAMPCINRGNGVYHSIAEEDGKERRFATPTGYTARASFGSWLLVYANERRGSDRCFLLRGAPNSPAMAIEVPGLYFQRGAIRAANSIRDDAVDMATDVKMIVCSPGLVVAIFRRHTFGAASTGASRRSNIACIRPTQQPPNTWSIVSPCDNHHRSDHVYVDMALYRGKIVALTSSDELFRYEFFDNGQKPTRDRLINHATDQHQVRPNNSYLVVSSDRQKLLMVRWNRRSVTDDHQPPTKDLRVFEADFDEGRWSEVKDLAGEVLFLGRRCSKAFKAGSLDHSGIGFQGGNCLFVLGNEWAEYSWMRPADYYGNDTPYYCVYDMVSGETSLVSLDRAHYIERARSGWYFPRE